MDSVERRAEAVRAAVRLQLAYATRGSSTGITVFWEDVERIEKYIRSGRTNNDR